jgi:hypothetical protein
MTAMPDVNLAEWDIPVTDEFVDGVRRGVRRRLLLRGAALGGAVIAAGAVLAVATAVTGTHGPAHNGTVPAAPTTSSTAAGTRLAGFHLTWLPDRAVQVGPDGTYTAAVTTQGLRNDGPTPAAGEPRALVTTRHFERDVGVGLFVSVLRPQPGTDPPAGTAQVGDWLVRWETRGGTSVKTFDVPVGTARLLAEVGSETTSHKVVITAAGHAVIAIEGNAAYTAAELEAVARGITG